MARSEAELVNLFEGAVGVAVESIKLMSGARTNSNYHVTAAGVHYSMRVPGEGTNGYIDRASEASNLRKASRAFDFVPDVVFADESTGLLVCEFLTGARSMTPEDASRPGVLAAVATRLAAVHGSGIEFSNVFRLSETKQGYEALLEAEGFGVPGEVAKEADVLDGALAEYEVRCSGSLVPCHGDPNMANFMEREGRLYLIDWEYSGMCSRLFDVANMAMTDRLDGVAESRLLRAYEEASGMLVESEDYILAKVAIDWMWLFWHLIKLSQGQMVDYNERSWRSRLTRALSNLGRIA